MCLCICFHVDGGRWGCMTADGWMRAMERKERERDDDEGGIWRVNRALCGAWYGCVTPGLRVASAMRLWQPQFTVCLDSEAPPREQLNNRWQERGSIHRWGDIHKHTQGDVCRDLGLNAGLFSPWLELRHIYKSRDVRNDIFQNKLANGLSKIRGSWKGFQRSSKQSLVMIKKLFISIITKRYCILPIIYLKAILLIMKCNTNNTKRKENLI